MWRARSSLKEEEGTPVKKHLLTVTASAMCVTAATHASSVTYALNSGTYQASATFLFDDATNTLGIQLVNTGAGTNGNGWLTGLFFDLAGSPTMTYSGMGAGSFNQLVDADLNGPSVGDPWEHHTADMYWALEQDAEAYLPDSVGDQEYALYAAGFFNLPGSAAAAPLVPGHGIAINGQDGGIVNDQVTINNDNHEPYVLDGVWFNWTLDVDDDFDLAGSLSNVFLQYGTSSSQPGFSVVVVPLPPAAWAGGIGLIAAGFMRRRFRN